ncbi:hypothetical protein ABE288_21035 [Bacillus salipaludis]|uniref:hypothetical protein n=1 Tax=Bacillus salipaludis TaxID=2547811 RepID=UPI003D1C14CE
MGDPNWLLTAIITISGSLVAIIGGFLVSRLIAISSERNGIKGKIADYKQEIKNIKDKINEEKQELLNLDQSWFKTTAFEYALRSASLDEIVNDKHINLNNHPEEVLKPWYENLLKKAEERKNKATQLLGPSEKLIPELEETLKSINLENVLELSNANANSMKEQLKAREKAQQEKLKRERFMAEEVARDMQKPHFAEIRNLEKKLNHWKAKIDDSKLHLSYIGKPKGIVSGIVFIGLTIIVGIGFPICFVPMSPGNLSDSMRRIFLGGLFVVLLYFFIYLIVLAADSDSNSD